MGAVLRGWGAGGRARGAGLLLGGLAVTLTLGRTGAPAPLGFIRVQRERGPVGIWEALFKALEGREWGNSR